MAVCLNELLGRPLLKIYQDDDSFCFSTDSMLLASFATINYSFKNIIDLCSGNAPIPLYLSLRTKTAKIYGVEILEESYNLGLKSVEINNLSNQITLLNANLKDVNSLVGKNKFQLVTVNPPFFKVGTSIINESNKLAVARHELLATLDDIVLEASKLLNSHGYLAMVHRPDRLIELIMTFKKYHIEPKRLQFVYPKEKGLCNHILIEGIKDGEPGGLKVLPPLFIYGSDGKWTEEIKKIYNYEE